MMVMDQVVTLYAATKGHLDAVPVEKIRTVERHLLEHIKEKHRGLVETLVKDQDLSNENAEKLDQVITSFLQGMGHGQH